MQPDDGGERAARAVDDVGAVSPVAAFLDLHDPAELLQERHRGLDTSSQRRIPIGGTSGQTAARRADHVIQVIPPQGPPQDIQELVQERNIPFGEEQLRPRRKLVGDGGSARAGPRSRPQNEPLALELLHVGSDRVVGDAQRGGQLLDGTVGRSQPVDDLAPGAREEGFPPASQRHGSAVPLGAGQ